MARGRNFVFALGRTPLRPQGHVCDQIRSLAHEFPVAEATTMWEICFVDQGEPLVSIVCVLSPLECHYSSCNFLPQARDAFGSKFAQKVAPTDQKGVRVCWLGGGRGLGGGGGHGVSLDARPPCGDNSPRPRHAKWLFKHAKNGENFRSTPLRPCRMSPALVYRG